MTWLLEWVVLLWDVCYATWILQEVIYLVKLSSARDLELSKVIWTRPKLITKGASKRDKGNLIRGCALIWFQVFACSTRPVLVVLLARVPSTLLTAWPVFISSLLDPDAGVVQTHCGHKFIHEHLLWVYLVPNAKLFSIHLNVETVLRLFSCRHELLEAIFIEFGVKLGLLIVAFLFETGAAEGRIRLVNRPATKLCHSNAHWMEFHLVASKSACFVRENVMKHAQVLNYAHVANFSRF